jgi:micrococcal nuclease
LALTYPLQWVVLILLACCGQAIAVDIRGRVVNVSDGDTLTLIDMAGRTFKVRLSGIDAPELGQPHGHESWQALNSMVSGKKVLLGLVRSDRYGRVLGKVLLDGRDINLQLIHGGYAWYYRKYAEEQSVEDRRNYRFAEIIARKQGRALWGRVNPIPPWDWRRTHDDTAAAVLVRKQRYRAGGW